MRAGTGTELIGRGWELKCAVHSRREEQWRNGVKNLHGSEGIPESQYKVTGYHGNKDACGDGSIFPGVALPRLLA